MADGGQRLLDVIDDPNALESFLGGLTADSELLPSAESVDNVVASLARSLEGDYEVDSPMSPNETLFDTLESSSNNLTDISQSYVPSDFENVNISNSGGQGGNNNYGMGSMSNGEVTHLQQQQSLQNSLSNVVQSGVVEQYLMSSNQQTITTNENSSSSSSVSSSIQQQFTSNCDSSSTVTTSSTSTTQYIQQQQQQIQINQNQIVLQNNNNSNATYIFNNQQKTQQMTSLSTSSVDGQQPSNNDSLNNMISISLSNNHNNSSTSSSNSEGGQGIMTNAFQQQEISQQQGHIQVINHGQQQTSNSNLNVISVNTTNNNNNNNTVSSTTANSVNITSNNSTSSIQQQQFQVANAVPQQATTTLNHLVSAGQTVSLANVGGAQIIATSSGNIVTTGQGQANIIQQIQSASGGQSYITMEQPTTALIAGPGAFGGTNLLVTGAPTYAVVPTGAQFLSNAIMTQPQAIQTLTKGPNGTYYQTTGGTQIVTASNVNSLQNVNVANSNAGKPKQPPQLLPKPQSNGGTNNTSGASTDSISSSSVTSTNTTQASGTVSTPTEGVVTQIFQQQQQIQGLQNPVVVTSMSNSGVTIQQQPSFTIGSTGLGQVVVSQNPTQQTQLTGTIVVNQYGQPMLLPSANAGQGGGLQFILRQQPTQPQVLTFQTPSGTATIGAQNANQGKSIVRYVPQMPQVAQSGGYGLQQIQTANGPAWVAVRYPQQTATTISAQHGQFSQIQTETVVPAQIQQQQQQVQVQVQTTQPQPVQQQQIIQPQPITPVTQPAPQPIVQQNPQKHQRSQDTTPDSSEPPPAKKPKAKAKSNKKKVTLDLEQLLKQSGIMDEDLEDDSSFDFSFSSQDAQHNGYGSPVVQEQNVVPVLQQSPVQHPAVNTSGKNKNGSTTTPKKPPAKSRSRKKPPAKPPTPPPPPTPKSGKGSKKKGGGNPKAEIKTDNSNKNNSKAPKKLSSIDDVSATIAAVAAAANSPSPPSSPAPTPSPASSLPLTPLTPRSITPSITPNPIPIQTQVQQAPYAPPISNSNGMNNPGPGPSSIASTTRIVQTIQLTPQNQQLLRNIQAQISRLLSLPKRNETEQTALQKLITLQQQVIATGVPVPNPTHLNNLAQSVNASVSSAILPTAATFSSASVSTSGGTTGAGEPLISSSNSTTPNANVTSHLQNNNNVLISLTTTNNQPSSNNAKLNTPQITETTTNATSTLKPSSVDTANSNEISSTNIVSNGPTGNLIQIPTGVVKVVISNANTETNNGPTEENKENTTASLVVASSTFSSGTSTTNSMGQHHLQSFPTNYRSALEDKKAEEQRIVTQKAEEEKRARWKKEEFEMLLKRDQQCVVKPDYEIPFNSKRDAVERLMKYHILRDRNDMNFEEFDYEFGEKASLLLDKFNGMIAKHRSLLLKESMKEVGCAERVMLERMFVGEEKLKLEQDRQTVSQGEVLDLAPPPASWVPRIQEMVDKEMKEMERDSFVNQQVQSAIDSIIGFGADDAANYLPDEGEKVEYDAFGVPINQSYNNGMNSSSADIDEAVRSILS